MTVITINTGVGIKGDKGPKGDKGDKGDKGNPGTPGTPGADGVADDESVAALIADETSETYGELTATFVSKPAGIADGEVPTWDDTTSTWIRGNGGGVDPDTATLGDATMKRYQPTPVTMTVVLTGHSLIYGQDTSATGTVPPGTGASQTRNPRRPAVSFASAIQYILPGASVVDQGFPGDRADQGLTRWASGVSGDVEFLWYETNENSQSIPVATYTANLTALVERSISRGSQPIVLGGGPTQYTGPTNRLIRAYTAASAAVAQRMGVPFYDIGEWLSALPTASIWAAGDNIHYSTEAYNLLGYKMASVIGPFADLAARVSPGAVIYPIRGGAYGGATIARTTERAGGQVLRLTAGQVAAIPVRVDAPCVVLFDFRASSDGNGVGTGSANMHLDSSGDVSKLINIPTHTDGKMTTVRGQGIRGVGIESLMISCATGSLELERIRFVSPDALTVVGTNDDTATGKRGVRSRLAGVTALGTGDGIFDDTCPIGAGQQGSTDYDNFDMYVVIPAGGDGRVSIAASVDRTNTALIATGYSARRNNADLLVYEHTASGTSTLLGTTTAVFPASGIWQGLIQYRLLGSGDIAVTVDNTVQYTITAAKWKHYIPGVWTGANPVTVIACTARHRVRG